MNGASLKVIFKMSVAVWIHHLHQSRICIEAESVSNIQDE